MTLSVRSIWVALLLALVACAWPVAQSTVGVFTQLRLGANRVLLDEDGGPLFRRATATITDAQIKACPTTPVTVLSAPGAGLVNVPIRFDLFSDFSAGAYTNINAAASMRMMFSASGPQISGYLANDAGTSPALDYVTQVFGAAADKMTYLLSVQYQSEPASDLWGLAPEIYTTTDTVNKAIQLTCDNNGGGNFTGGNAANTLRVVTFYVAETP